MNRAEKVILVLFVIVISNSMVSLGTMNSTGAGELPPSEIITCRGCVLTQDPGSADIFSAWVKKDSAITLSGPSGYQSYFWTGGGQTGYNQSISLKITGEAVYTLVLDGDKVKKVKIMLSSPQIICTIDLTEIKIDSTRLVVGQRIAVKANYHKSECPNAVIEWTSDEDELYFEDPQAQETWLVVGDKPASGKNPIIRVKVTNGDQFDEESVSLIIAGNSRPLISSLSTTPEVPTSRDTVLVNCYKCFTGDGSNDEGDFISGFRVRVKSLDGTYDKVFTQTYKKDNTGSISVSIGRQKEGFYDIEAQTRDSANEYSEAFYDKIYVGFGNTSADAPYIYLEEPILCNGLECTFDTGETEDNGLGLSRYYYYRTIAGFEPLRNKNGDQCRSAVCYGVFPKGGIVYEVKITIQYIREGKLSGKISEMIVKVPVGEFAAETDAPRAAVSATVSVARHTSVQSADININGSSANNSAAGECGKDYECKDSPDIGIFLGLIAVVFAASRRKK